MILFSSAGAMSSGILPCPGRIGRMFSLRADFGNEKGFFSFEGEKALFIWQASGLFVRIDEKDIPPFLNDLLPPSRMFDLFSGGEAVEFIELPGSPEG